jgi:hypothetical protein
MKLGESLTSSADRRISIKISLDTIMDPLCVSQVVSEQLPRLFQTEEPSHVLICIVNRCFELLWIFYLATRCVTPSASYDDLSLDYLS